MLPFTTYNIPETSEKETPPSSKWLWIVVSDPLSPDDEDLLRKICTALKADFNEDVHVYQADQFLNISFSSLTYEELKLIISFGVPPSDLGIWIDITMGRVRFLEAYAFILTPSLEELSKSPVAKKQLWSSMLLFLEKN